jgi:hypothetical protein
MSYFRHQYSSFQEFVREGLHGGNVLGKEELELLRAIEEDDEFDRPKRRSRRSVWDLD